MQMFGFGNKKYQQTAAYIAATWLEHFRQNQIEDSTHFNATKIPQETVGLVGFTFETYKKFFTTKVEGYRAQPVSLAVFALAIGAELETKKNDFQRFAGFSVAMTNAANAAFSGKYQISFLDKAIIGDALDHCKLHGDRVFGDYLENFKEQFGPIAVNN